MTKKTRELPGWPRGLSRELASAYIGVSTGLFDEMVRDGRMPSAKQINRRRVWDIHAVDIAFTKLGDSSDSSWDAEVNLGGGPPPRRFGDRISRSNVQADQKWCPPEYEMYRGEDWFKDAKFYKEGEWEALICSRPLGIREKRAPEGYFLGKGNTKLDVNGAGPETIERLVARGFIEFVAERGEGRVPYYGITTAGEAAWQALNSEHPPPDVR